VRRARIGGPHPDPREVRGQVVPPLAVRHLPRLGLLVEQVEPLVAGEEVDPPELAEPLPGERLHETQRVGDRRDPALILGRERGVAGEIEPPVLGVMEVGEAAVDQRPDEVEGERRALVAAQEELRIGPPALGRELGVVDDVAPVGGQHLSVPLLGRLRARLGVLPHEPPHPDHPPLAAVDEHEAHLQEDLQLRGDRRGGAVGEALGAVASLEEEALPRRRLGELPLEQLDLPGGDERRQPRQLGDRRRERRRIVVLGLLRGRAAPPGIRCPIRGEPPSPAGVAVGERAHESGS